MNSNHPGTKFMYGDWILRILRTVFHCSRIVCPEGSSMERLWVIRNSNNNRRIIDIHSASSTRRFFCLDERLSVRSRRVVLVLLRIVWWVSLFLCIPIVFTLCPHVSLLLSRDIGFLSFSDLFLCAFCFVGCCQQLYTLCYNPFFSMCLKYVKSVHIKKNPLCKRHQRSAGVRLNKKHIATG